MGKMPNTGVREALSLFAGHAPTVAKMLRAHISAVEAERDEMRGLAHIRERERNAMQSERDAANDGAALMDERCHAAESERDSLRERVKALEQVREQDARRHAVQVNALREAVASGKSTLAAIRQRAEDSDTLLTAYRTGGMIEVARHILGDGLCQPSTVQDSSNSGPSELDGLPEPGETHPAAGVATEGGKAKCPKCSHSVEARGTYARVPEHLAPEPTTAEAFATVRANLPCAALRSLRLLSLLECRMGARALKDGQRALECGEERGKVEDVLLDALADAPPVFKRREIIEAMRDAGVGMGAACDVLEHLSALRRTP